MSKKKICSLMGWIFLLSIFAFNPGWCATLSGTITDENTGAPIEYAWVSSHKWNVEGWWGYVGSQSTTEDGTFSFQDLEAGTYVLYAGKWGFGEKSWWCEYYDEWYDDVPGWNNMENAKKITLVQDETSDITHDLMLVPFKVEIQWKQSLIPPQGGRFNFSALITNRQDSPMSIKWWTFVWGPGSEYDMGTKFQAGKVSEAIAFSAGETKGFRGRLLVPSSAPDSWYNLYVLVGPSEGTPWRTINYSVTWFEKGATMTSLAQEKMKEMIRQKLEPPARIIPGR